MVKTVAQRNHRRYHELRTMLEQRYRELASQIKGGIRDGRTQDTRASLPGDDNETPDASVEGEIDLAVIELKADMLHRVSTALSRLDEGTYGGCSECGGQIPEARLRAMPFAIRCRGCESAREEGAQLRAGISRDRLLRRLS
jgi:DnaK suppressor protein